MKSNTQGKGPELSLNNQVTELTKLMLEMGYSLKRHQAQEMLAKIYREPNWHSLTSKRDLIEAHISETMINGIGINVDFDHVDDQDLRQFYGGEARLEDFDIPEEREIFLAVSEAVNDLDVYESFGSTEILRLSRAIRKFHVTNTEHPVYGYVDVAHFLLIGSSRAQGEEAESMLGRATFLLHRHRPEVLEGAVFDMKTGEQIAHIQTISAKERLANEIEERIAQTFDAMDVFYDEIELTEPAELWDGDISSPWGVYVRDGKKVVSEFEVRINTDKMVIHSIQEVDSIK